MMLTATVVTGATVQCSFQTPHGHRPQTTTGAKPKTVKGLALSSDSSVAISARFPAELIRQAQQLAEHEDPSVSWLL